MFDEWMNWGSQWPCKLFSTVGADKLSRELCQQNDERYWMGILFWLIVVSAVGGIFSGIFGADEKKKSP